MHHFRSVFSVPFRLIVVHNSAPISLKQLGSARPPCSSKQNIRKENQGRNDRQGQAAAITSWSWHNEWGAEGCVQYPEPSGSDALPLSSVEQDAGSWRELIASALAYTNYTASVMAAEMGWTTGASRAEANLSVLCPVRLVRKQPSPERQNVLHKCTYWNQKWRFILIWYFQDPNYWIFVCSRVENCKISNIIILYYNKYKHSWELNISTYCKIILHHYSTWKTTLVCWFYKYKPILTDSTKVDNTTM